MNFLEKNLEDIIFETPNEKLQDRGLNIHGRKKRQVKIGNYGIADVISVHADEFDPNYHNQYSRQITFTVYELKKEKIDANALMQAYRYKRGIERYLREKRKLKRCSIQIALIGKEICMGDFCYMQDSINGLSVYTYSYGFDGITFDSPGAYCLIEEGFNG